jgi:hypothetical protein
MFTVTEQLRGATWGIAWPQKTGGVAIDRAPVSGLAPLPRGRGPRWVRTRVLLDVWSASGFLTAVPSEEALPGCLVPRQILGFQHLAACIEGGDRD